MNRCGKLIKAKLGPFTIRLHCTLAPNHAALGMAEHQWVWENPLYTVSAPQQR